MIPNTILLLEDKDKLCPIAIPLVETHVMLFPRATEESPVSVVFAPTNVLLDPFRLLLYPTEIPFVPEALDCAPTMVVLSLPILLDPTIVPDAVALLLCPILVT